MKINKTIKVSAMVLALVTGTISCKKDKMEDEPMAQPALASKTFSYEFNNGQVVSSAAYDGMHQDNLTAELKVDELANGMAKITVTLNNTVNGQTYNVHAHDAADPASTPNGTPYNEMPNSGVLVQTINGNGASASASQETNISYSDVINTYSGFFVVHDPLQTMSTVDISTYLIVGTFARTQAATGYASSEFNIAFNTGQLNAAYAYSGTHATNLSAVLKVQELGDGQSRVSVALNNSINGQTYNVHSHDQADPATTPNGTPYNETPNSNVLVLQIAGNGGMAYNNQISTMSHADLTTTYDGFFVVHDPLQAMTTTDPTTYVLLDLFAR